MGSRYGLLESSYDILVVGCGGRGGAGAVFGNGILQIGWPDRLEEKTQAPVLFAAKRAEEANPVAATRRHEKEKERDKAQLDPRRSFYYPNPNPNTSENARGGGGEEAEAHTKHVSATQPGSHFNTPSTSTSSPLATASSAEYALFSERMADTSHSQSHGHVMGYSFAHTQQIPQPQTVSGVTQTSTRMRGGVGGEIVAVQGGHIVRSTGRKDRHSKVCTAKGPRDRRVRLSAHTAIQFYDVQDRLGYDRPSKAVDWLIKNAKDAIDKLAELPAWTPTTGPVTTASITAVSVSMAPENQLLTGVNPSFDFGGGSGSSSNNPSRGFLPPSLDSDAIADTIKSFFPLGAATASGTNQTPSPAQTIGFQTYAHEPLQRTNSNQNQDLRLSLQSFQDPIYHSSQQHHGATFAGSGTNLGYGSGSGSTLWPDPNQIMQWSMADGASGSGGATGGGGGFLFSMPQQASQQAVPMQVLGQSQLFLQRGPLQSSNSPSVRSWVEPISSESDHQMHPGLYESIGFRSGGSSFSGFRIPARIHGEEEEHGGLSHRPPSASRH